MAVEGAETLLLIVAVDFPKAELVENENEGAEPGVLGNEKLGDEEAEDVTELELEALRNENPGAEDEAGGVVIELEIELDDDVPVKLEKDGAADDDEPNKPGKDGAADDDEVTDEEPPNVVEEKLRVDTPEEEEDPNKPEENGELTVVVAAEVDDEAEEAPKMLVVPNVELGPNKLVVVVVVPLELELDPNKPDPPNGDDVAGDVVPNNVELVAAPEEVLKPKEGDGADGAAEDGVEDEDDANANPKEGADDDADDEGAPNVGLGGADENGDGDEDDGNENANGDDDEDDEVEEFVEKEEPDIVDASLSL